MKVLKKYIFPCLIISLVLNAFLIIRQNQFYSNSNSTDYSLVYHHLDSMIVENFLKKFEDGERIVVYFGRPSCSDCDNVDDILVELIYRYNLGDKIKYVNVEDEYQKGKLHWDKFKNLVSISGTPTFAIYDKQKMISKYDFEENGGFTIEDFKIWLQDNGLLQK